MLELLLFLIIGQETTSILHYSEAVAAPEQLADSGKFIFKRKKWFLISPIQYKNVGILTNKEILPI